MSNDLIKETQQLAKSYAVDFKDCGNGHIQLRAHGVLVNYYPNSKQKSLYSPTLNRREKNCLPWDAIRLCQSGAKSNMKPKKPAKNRAQFSLDPVKTNPAKLKHFYAGEVPPWELPGEYSFNTDSDKLRHDAYLLEQQALLLREDANELDKAA